MSQSFTILPYLNPPCGAYDASNATSSLDNNFTVSQTFGAGIVDSGNLTVVGTSSFAGVCTFNSIPKFNAGVEIAISEVNTGTLVVAGQSTLNGGLIVAGIVELPAGTINQSEVSSGYVDLVNAQTVSGVKTFSSPPVASGASLSAGSIPALSIVNKSLGDAQITLSGIGQTSIASGYVDLVNTQTVAGAKTFSGGVTVAGSTSLQSTTATTLGVSSITASGSISSSTGMVAPTFTGALVGNATSATLAQTVNILTDNTAGLYSIPFLKTNVGSDSIFVDDVTTPILTYNPSTGALSAGSLVTSAGITGAGLTSSNGLVVSNGNSSIQGGVILPVAQTTLSLVSGAVTVNLNNLSLNEFIIPSANFTANITSMIFQNAIVNSKFNIYIQGGAANRTINKNLSSGAVSQVNTLSGNTQVASGSTWRCEGVVLSSTLVSLQFTNFT